MISAYTGASRQSSTGGTATKTGQRIDVLDEGKFDGCKHVDDIEGPSVSLS